MIRNCIVIISASGEYNGSYWYDTSPMGFTNWETGDGEPADTSTCTTGEIKITGVLDPMMFVELLITIKLVPKL